MVTNFYLGANSRDGFQSLYGGYTEPEDYYDIMVLKGGPGVGKSTFMKYIGSQAEAAGEDVEYIWCSGDPDSLDAVRLPRVGILAVDGTSPHGSVTTGHHLQPLRRRKAPGDADSLLS